MTFCINCIEIINRKKQNYKYLLETYNVNINTQNLRHICKTNIFTDFLREYIDWQQRQCPF